jgi:hypothetical protein
MWSILGLGLVLTVLAIEAWRVRAVRALPVVAPEGVV